jgi:hypothetical protein
VLYVAALFIKPETKARYHVVRTKRWGQGGTYRI